MKGNPNFVEEHQSALCRGCGADLSGVERVLDHVTQEIDVPLSVSHLTEHRHYVKRCSCDCLNRSSNPRQRGGNIVTYGKNIRAIVVYLSVVQCIPYKRLQSLIETMFGVHTSQGTIRNILQDANCKSARAIELIKRAIMSSPIVGFDESGCFCEDRLDWSWIAQTAYYTLVFRGSGRGGKELEKVFGNSLKNMIAVTDRHSAYFALEFLGHQVCLAHLLRELEYLNELDKEQTWSKDMKDLLQESIHERNKDLSVKMDKKPWLKRLDNLLQRSVEHLKKDFTRLKNGLLRCRDYLFNFLENPAIPPTNNNSERGIRKLKVKQKIPGTFRSEDGADVFHNIHSIVDTARKNGQPQLQAILSIL
jgi:Transposase IS66 family.